MDKFTASNGLTVGPHKQAFLGHAIYTSSGRNTLENAYSHLNLEEMQALREFFRAERDEELGRWRWPENPDYVVYARGAGWIVMSEWSTNSKHYSHREHAEVGDNILSQAMRAYFEAHPERKPWEDAQPGDIWVLTLDGDEVAYQCLSSFAGHVYFGGADDTIELNSTMITDGRRIWPEGD